MIKHIFLFLFCVIFISCSNDSQTTSNDIDIKPTPEINQIEQDAFEVLFNSAQFASIAVGIAGSPPQQVAAFQTILASEYAEYLFQKLQADAKIEGQMYGLCGLYLVNKAYFDSVVSDYYNSNAEVSTFIGCILSSHPVNEIIPSIEDGGWPESYRDCPL
ncbi:MAG: hypothetical protein DWP97_03885 [Calditrichaeota bacterium]|nr:MAG: hypothetical protein DWP97_03885 [Calditrichota bacterium]